MNEKLLIVEDEFIVANDLTIILENAGYQVCGTADTVESAKAAVDRFRPTWVILDIFLQDDSMGTDLTPYLQERGIGYIYLSANTNQSILEVAKATQPYGFLVKPFREKDLLIMLDIARSKHESSLQFAAQRETLLQQQMRSLSEEALSYEHKLQKIPAVFQSLIPFDYLAFRYESTDSSMIKSGAFYRVGFNEYSVIAPLDEQGLDDIFFPETGQVNSIEHTSAKIFQGRTCNEPTDQQPLLKTGPRQYELNASLQFLSITREGLLQLNFCNKNLDAFDQSHINLLCKTRHTVFKLFSLLPGPTETAGKIFRKASRLQSAKPVSKFEGIYGKSAALLHVLDNIELVAPTPVSVLILGESGTGKESVARNIHLLSQRRYAPFITVNCAALPADLIESELFGHEKGAFTGAVEKRIGKFEMAQEGTVFLDEIGEMPLESQVKLLRVLQEKQFERVGSGKTIKVDVRIVAATNRNLEKEVAEGRFRLDLFYRLNVYPIQVPPLRERKEDIPLLAQHFLVLSAANMERAEVPELTATALNQLTDYHWPGNIRELEHLMQRTLIKTKAALIGQVELPVLSNPRSQVYPAAGSRKTLEQIETEHILTVLRSCSGKLTGMGGAAEILGLPPSTLTSRMKKLGIKKELYHGI
ncbi:formate hydrogenlyase transcriptional activator [Pedobacter westerhofensis]|uniref:Formate hydrogenlyase transcriptional activator n=1 Tax=Pedobacter westerhofensis TaxID=425512 RepID=A0A521BP91_9SPHI|nr:sigma 54-interacting transcriptional regulator [Pedobacter westerhofensis]SMO48885.1 formate hydrogenlyase transcriptional activator [Pedobacter westerhofensis]